MWDISDCAIKFERDIVEQYRLNIIEFINKIQTEVRIPNLLLESMYIASIYIKGTYKIDDELFSEILKDNIYKGATSNASSSKNKVESRLNCVCNRLSEHVGRGQK